MIAFANAKINLGLDIIEKRNDGYHNVSSCFYPVSLSDVLEVLESDKLTFSQTGINFPGDHKNNLVIKAYEIINKDIPIPPVSIHLHKTIPVGAGLGGGSSDAAQMLALLNTLFELFLDDSLLADYALQLGSDCPFFIYNRPMIAEGRGEILEGITPKLEGHYLYLVKPDTSVSTKEAYSGVIPFYPEIPVRKIIEEHPVREWKELLKNDFEASVFRSHPELKEIKEALYVEGALFASMTGSGAAIYGIFEKEPERASSIPSNYFQWTGQL